MKPPQILPERIIVNQALNYLRTLKVSQIESWINEEHPGPYNRSHPSRRRGSDIQGIIKSQGGRFLAIEIKTPPQLKIINSIIERKVSAGGKSYRHYLDQIGYLEMIKSNGGLAFFADSWELVRNKMIEEGLDKQKEAI